jgi:hypothetical protein
MPEAGSKEFKQLIQTVESPFRYEGIEFEKENPVNYYIDNMLRRTFSHLFGYTGKVWTPVQVTSSGNMKTSQQGSSFENYEYQAYSGQTGQVDHTFANTQDLIIVSVTAGTITMAIDNGSGAFGSPISVPNYGAIELPVQSKILRFQANAATFTVLGLY